ncbi:MAG: hypothetical protein KAI72_07755, partial [Candidatus Pacebacteria bacterium]|nr:hypothetical protein [Candidatus Paceibacterota bacterium]
VEESKTGPPLGKDKKEQEEEEALKGKEGIFEIPKVTDMPIEKEPAKIIENTTKESAMLRQTVEFVRVMINEGKRGVELIKILKKAGLANERIINALTQMGFNLKDIIIIFKEANLSCTEIVQSIHKARVSYSDKEIYEALLKAGFTDKDIVAAFKTAGISAVDILKLATDLKRDMTAIAKAMVDARYSFADIGKAYVLKAMKGVWDDTVNIINCAVKAFDSFVTNIGRKFTSKEDLAYELIVDDILATGEVEITDKDVMTSMMAIKNVANKYGISLEGFKLSLDSLKELDENAIILLDSNHWVTIVSIDGDEVTIIDNGQEQVISLTELNIRWDGSTLALNNKELQKDRILDLQMRQIRGGRSIGGVLKSVFKSVKKIIKKIIKPLAALSFFHVYGIIGFGIAMCLLYPEDVEQSWEKVKKEAKRVWGKIKKEYKRVEKKVRQVRDAAKGVYHQVRGNDQRAQEYFQKAGWVGKHFQRVGKIIAGVVNIVKSSYYRIIGNQEKAQHYWDKGWNQITEVVMHLINQIPIHFVRKCATAVWNGVKAFVQGAMNFVTGLSMIFTGEADAFKVMFSGFAQMCTAPLVTLYQVCGEKIGRVVSQVIQWVVRIVAAVLSFVFAKIFGWTGIGLAIGMAIAFVATFIICMVDYDFVQLC